MKWKVGGRVDGDIVYATSNFYLEPVKRNQRFSAIWGENYLDVSAGSWDFRVGAQQIVWGEVVGLFFADVVSARDTREFLLPSFDVIRIPQWAARAEYFAGDSHVEFVWIPVPTFDRIGKPGADFYPAPLPSPTPADVAALFQDPQRPGPQSRAIRTTAFAPTRSSRVGTSRRSTTAASARSRRSIGWARATPAQPFVFQPRYDRIWQAGGTVSKDLGDMVLRGEAVYANGQGYSVTSLAAPQGVVQRSTLDYILSVEFPLPGDTRLNIQGFQRAYLDGGGGDLAIKSDGFGASVFLSTKLDRSVRAADPVDTELQGRRRHDSAAPQLVRGEERRRGIRRRHLHRTDATATSAATTTAIASTRSCVTTSRNADRATRRRGVGLCRSPSTSRCLRE